MTSTSSTSSTLTGPVEWLIVGAGPHGCHLAVRLLSEGKCRPEELLLVDPSPPLEVWKRRTRNSGMTYPRSSETHHIAPSTAGLRRWVKSHGAGPESWSGKFACPRLDLFNAHSQAVLIENKIHQRWLPGKASHIARTSEGYAVQVAEQTIHTRNVVLAVGPPEELCWCQQLPRDGRVHHLLDSSFRLEEFQTSGPVCVLGSGMTATQAALSLAQNHQVHLLSNKPLIIQDFDFRTDWVSMAYPKLAKLDGAERRTMITKLRAKGSVNPRVAKELALAQRDGRLTVHVSQKWAWSDPTLHWGDEQFEPSAILLGTGFERQSPGGQMVQNLTRDLDLPVSPCGFPLTDATLQWAPGLYVMGMLAELNVGPCSANLLGARLAAQAILSR